MNAVEPPEPVTQDLSIEAQNAPMPNWEPDFVGGDEYTIDTKRRFKFRNDWAPENPEDADLVLAVVPDAERRAYCVRVMEIGQLREIEAKIKNQLADKQITLKQATALRRIFFSDSARVKPDANWRICLPERLAKKAGLSKKVYIVGMGEWFEIWDHKTYVETDKADMDDQIDAMEGAGI